MVTVGNTSRAAADRDGVEELEEAQTQFADYLKDFCGGPDGGGTDEESMLLGAVPSDDVNLETKFRPIAVTALILSAWVTVRCAVHGVLCAGCSLRQQQRA